MFGRGVESGLSIVGAIVVFAIVVGGNYWWGNNQSKINASVQKMPEKQKLENQK